MEATRPIVFGAESIHGIEEGVKWQTRRLGLPRPINDDLGYTMFDPGTATLCGADYPDGEDDRVKCPYGRPGDVLWVREAWGIVPKPPVRPGQYHPKCITNPRIGEPDEDIPGITWRAAWISSEGVLGNPSGLRFKSARYMPRWASRMYVRIDKIRVQRLQDISEKDAIAEGVRQREFRDSRGRIDQVMYLGGENPQTQVLTLHPTAVRAYASLWDSINGKRNPPKVFLYEKGANKRIVSWKKRRETPSLPWCCWTANDWVWVVDFSVAWRYGEQLQQERI